MGWNTPPPDVNCIPGEGGVGTPRRDGAAGWGGGLCIEDRADNVGRCQPATADDTELSVEPKWLAVNWVTTSPLSLATTWTASYLARASAVALA
jgi:hypothetical protein